MTDIRVLLTGGDGADEAPIPDWMVAGLEPGALLAAEVAGAGDGVVVLRVLRWVAAGRRPFGVPMLCGAADAVNEMILPAIPLPAGPGGE